MEVSAPQKVQINFNNKIITLHNVTILKNPKIFTIDASQYSNFLKGGSPVKLLNGNQTTPVKLQLPSLVPMKTPQQTDNSNKITDAPLIRQITPNQLQPFSMPVPSSSIKLQPVKQQTVIISPPKASSNSQVRIGQTILINKSSTVPINKIPTKVIVKSPPRLELNATPLKNPPALKPLQIPSKIVFSEEKASLTPLKPLTISQEALTTSVPAKVIVSPPRKTKLSPCSISPPEAKRTCTKLDFHCIFCESVYKDSSHLIDHMKLEHGNSFKVPSKNISIKEENLLDKAESVMQVSSQKIETNFKEEIFEATPYEFTEPSHEEVRSDTRKIDDERNESMDEEDDDESEVNDLLVDLEETTQGSSQARSDTPESPEFEEHVPLTAVKLEESINPTLDEDVDCEDFEYFCNIMEPICQLSCDDDSQDGEPKENEAMRLYREAMDINYQQNGIKKRGRRKQRKVKPLDENSINSILAGLLESNSVLKVPPGPGRGRRKEMNEEELEMERINGTCLFSCNKCDETFKYAGDLAKHVRSHTISSPYQCTICQRKFTHIGSLNTHLRIHSGERPYKCNQCDKSFTQSNSLMVHVKSHLSNKPFQCIQCNKGFQNASSLALHQKSHTSPSETVVCPIDDCGKEFRDNNLLEEHLMTHRNSLLYQCSLCSEKFDQSCLLVQHVKKHVGDKPFQCNQCGKCFTQPGSLNTHLRIHTGEKPFKCEVCGKNFTQASSLSVHAKVHGEKQFKCEVEDCGKSFGQEITLRKHMLKHIASFNDENCHFKTEMI